MEKKKKILILLILLLLILSSIIYLNFFTDKWYIEWKQKTNSTLLFNSEFKKKILDIHKEGKGFGYVVTVINDTFYLAPTSNLKYKSYPENSFYGNLKRGDIIIKKMNSDTITIVKENISDSYKLR